MNKNNTGLRRVEELKYGLERNNFLLSILTTRVLVCLYNDGVGEPDSQTSIIEKISPQYVNLIRSVRNRFPNDSPEDLAQELYNMIYIEDNGYKRDYSHFRVFDEDLLNEWHILREKQKQLFSERVALDSILADAQNAYYSVHGRDIEWHEIQDKSERKQQEEKQETEVDVDSWCETQKKEHQMEIIARLVVGDAITPEVAFEYMNKNNDFHDYDNFLRILDIWTEKEGEESE